MSTQHTAQSLPHEEAVDDELTTELAIEVDDLADVVELSEADDRSWYQRNSGELPKSEQGMASSHRRRELPTPQFEDRVSFTDRIRGLLNR